LLKSAGESDLLGVTVTWDFGDGSSATGWTTKHSYRQAGTYLITAEADSGSGKTTRQIELTVPLPESVAPAVSVSPQEGFAPLLVRLEAVHVEAPDELLIWTFGDGTTATGRSVSHTFTSPGTYEVLVGLAGHWGHIRLARAAVTASRRNESPRASISVSTTVGDAPLSVRFDASGSTDPDGTIRSYEWSFGDGATARGQSVTHVYSYSGYYRVRLTVTDDAGAANTAQAAVTVSQAPPEQAFWVAPWGDDGNAGRQDSPWRTLTFAVSRLAPGDTLYVAGRFENEWLDLTDLHGEPDAPIVICGIDDAYLLTNSTTRPPLKLNRTRFVTVSDLTVSIQARGGTLRADTGVRPVLVTDSYDNTLLRIKAKNSFLDCNTSIYCIKYAVRNRFLYCEASPDEYPPDVHLPVHQRRGYGRIGFVVGSGYNTFRGCVVRGIRRCQSDFQYAVGFSNYSFCADYGPVEANSFEQCAVYDTIDIAYGIAVDQAAVRNVQFTQCTAVGIFLLRPFNFEYHSDRVPYEEYERSTQNTVTDCQATILPPPDPSARVQGVVGFMNSLPETRCTRVTISAFDESQGTGFESLASWNDPLASLTCQGCSIRNFARAYSDGVTWIP